MFVLVTYDINVAAPEGAKRLRRERVCSYSCACSCRSPHGERGLKSCTMNFSAPDSKSLPARGAWIEIVKPRVDRPNESRRSPHGERGLKSLRPYSYTDAALSLPARGAWIEICSIRLKPSDFLVAPRTGSVD